MKTALFIRSYIEIRRNKKNIPDWDNMTILYLCDPSRNKDCTKECCYMGEGDWRPCSDTLDPDAAFTNSKGEAIIDKDFWDNKEENINV